MNIAAAERAALSNGVGGPNGPSYRPFDRWFRYPAGFSAPALDRCFDSLQVNPGALVMDPLAGVATAGLQACQRGYAFIGMEAHPLIAELASLKFVQPVAPWELRDHAECVVKASRPGDASDEADLVTRCFEKDTLSALIGLRKSVEQLADDRWYLHLKWCLLGALRDCATVKVGWPYQRPALARSPRIDDPGRAFLRRASWIAEDLVSRNLAPTAGVLVGDARAPADWCRLLAQRRADCVVTSPPYLNNFDYADATRLELYFWGFVRSWREMTAQVRSGMVIATTQQSRRALARRGESTLLARCPKTAERILELTGLLAAQRAERPRGKEYDQVLPSYFADLTDVLQNVHSHTVPGASVALVLGDSAPYGVYVDTPGILAALAAELGFERKELVPLRRRGLRWHNNGGRHGQPLMETLVVLRSPGVV